MLNKKALTGTASAAPLFVDELFSTYLYTGNGSSQTITNGIDLAGKGGMVWNKSRSNAYNQWITDTARGATNTLFTDLTDAQATIGTGLTAFNSNGFNIGSAIGINDTSKTFASWTFRKAPKFFDVVTWTGDGTGNRAIPHSLGSVPGFIQPKRTDASETWYNFHRSVTSPNANWWRNYAALNTTNGFTDWGDNSGLYQAPDANNLYIGSWYNGSGKTYVAYLFAHDAGGFGDAGTDNIISCGSFVHNGTTEQTIDLGYEPQFVLIKGADTATGWSIMDNMRGAPVGGNAQLLFANDSGAEFAGQQAYPTARGFAVRTGAFLGGTTHIYMAIRRPMKTPTSGTEVFDVEQSTTDAYNVNSGFSVDLGIIKEDGGSWFWNTRLTDRNLKSNNTGPEDNYSAYFDFDSNTQFKIGSGFFGATDRVNYVFRRAPGFFDVVCYTGTGSATTVTHNLGVAPELMIVKRRNTTNAWAVYANNDNTDYLVLNTTAATADDNTYWNDTTPTSSVFSVGTNNAVNASGSTYVAYLFASLDGISKVGSYTGNGSSQTINCGFSAGARFVLIKATSTTGDWVVFDSSRGIVSGNDPFLQLNSTAAEVTNEDAIDPDNSGFVVNETTEALNTNGVSYLYLAIS